MLQFALIKTHSNALFISEVLSESVCSKCVIVTRYSESNYKEYLLRVNQEINNFEYIVIDLKYNP